MNPEPLAPIYLDNKPIVLKDPKPLVSAVLSAGGQEGVTQVRWLQAQSSPQGTLLRADHALDRTSEPTKPIYLTSLKGPAGGSLTPPWERAPLGPAAGKPIVDEEIKVRPFAGKRPTPMGKRESFDAPKGKGSMDESMDAADDDTAGDEDENKKSGE